VDCYPWNWTGVVVASGTDLEEKVLKAQVVHHTGDLAPRIHNLVRLAELAEIQLSPDQLDLLADMNVFNLEGRYPETLAPLPSQAETAENMSSAGEVLAWLMNL
jgi:hypothetical protein